MNNNSNNKQTDNKNIAKKNWNFIIPNKNKFKIQTLINWVLLIGFILLILFVIYIKLTE
jgi:hypothetical protein